MKIEISQQWKPLILSAVSVMYNCVFRPFAIDLQVVTGGWQEFGAEHLLNGQME